MYETLKGHTYYEVLDIPSNAEQHQVVLAYHNAKKFYSLDNPDIYQFFTRYEALSFIQLIDEAFEVLGNIEKRRYYDEKLFGTAPCSEPAEALKPQERRPLEPQRDESFEIEIRNERQFSGSFLSKVREHKGISLEDLAQATCVKKNYLLAIESEDFSALPAPVFVRGYVKHIARTLGIDEKKAANSFMERMKSLR